MFTITLLNIQDLDQILKELRDPTQNTQSIDDKIDPFHYYLTHMEIWTWTSFL